MKKMILIISVCFMTLIVLFLSQNHYFELNSSEIDFGTEIALTVNGLNTTTFPKKESNLKVKNISCNEGIAYWDYSSWSLRVRNVTNTKVKCNIDFVNEYHETILNGTDPVLGSGLIPVTIEADGVVKRAKLGSEWYSYEKKIWANAVILEDESKIYYEGEIIPENNIESYFVWIPRYKYKIFNEGKYSGVLETSYQNKAQEIEIVFENKNTSTSNGSTVGSYLTHPAFTSFNSNGMWVGKFETGYKGAISTEESEQDIVNTAKIQIKPNVYSWRKIKPANAHLNSYNYQRDYDSHMMKNTEWGAVAYLSHSQYGSQTSVRVNNNDSFITGYSAVNEPTTFIGESEATSLGQDGSKTLYYFNPKSVLSSTTDNYSGIYDMSGGAYEYVMGVMTDKNGIPLSGRNSLYNSGFNGLFSTPSSDSDVSGKIELTTGVNFPDSKYYDTYVNAENIWHFERRIMGDATGELGPFYNNESACSWYKDISNPTYSRNPWIDRGGGRTQGAGAGIFNLGQAHGNKDPVSSFRIVLVF